MQDEGSKDEPKTEAEGTPEAKPRIVRKIFRVAEKDLDGDLKVEHAIRKISGVGFTFAHAIARTTGFGGKKLCELNEDQRKQLEDAIRNPERHNIPAWLLNRRFDPEDGTDKHLVSSTLMLKRKTDINVMKKNKTYKGIRHSAGLPVRGQRTRSSFRTHGTVGVSRSKGKK